MENSVTQRVRQMMRKYDLNGVAFSDRIGWKQSTFASKLRGEREFKLDELKTISEYFPEVSDVWLLTGEGDMLRSSVPSVSPSPDGVSAPYFDVDFRGGFDFLYNDQTTVPSGFVSVPGAMRVSCWCNVSGRSMEPDISPGDIVGLQLVEDTSFLPFGEIYAVVTRSGMRTVKRIGPSHTQGCVSLIPSNSSPEYAPQDIPLSELVTVFRIVAKITKF